MTYRNASTCPNWCNLLVEQVKERTSVHNTFNYGSHVMQYGSLDLGIEHLFTYIGSNPANDNATFVEDNSLPSFSKAVNQRDADLVYFWQKVRM
jgi:legumain